MPGTVQPQHRDRLILEHGEITGREEQKVHIESAIGQGGDSRYASVPSRLLHPLAQAGHQGGPGGGGVRIDERGQRRGFDQPLLRPQRGEELALLVELQGRAAAFAQQLFAEGEVGLRRRIRRAQGEHAPVALHRRGEILRALAQVRAEEVVVRRRVVELDGIPDLLDGRFEVPLLEIELRLGVKDRRRAAQVGERGLGRRFPTHCALGFFLRVGRLDLGQRLPARGAPPFENGLRPEHAAHEQHRRDAERRRLVTLEEERELLPRARAFRTGREAILVSRDVGLQLLDPAIPASRSRAMALRQTAASESGMVCEGGAIKGSISPRATFSTIIIASSPVTAGRKASRW